MNESNILHNKLIYDNEVINQSNGNSKIKKTLNYLLLSLTVILSTLLLIFSDRTILAEKMLIPNSLKYFFNFQSQSLEQLNALIIFRFLVFGFVFVYSIAKNYNNLYSNKQTAKKYISWYCIYLSLTFISFGLFFGYFEILPSKIVNISLLLLVLFLVNLSYSITNYFQKIKLEPLLYRSKNVLIIPIVSQFILTIIFIALPYIWIYLGQSKDLIFYGNTFFNKLNNLLTVKSIGNVFILFFISLVLITLIVGANYSTINLIINKKYNFELLKNKLYLLACFVISFLLWYIRLFAYKHNLLDIFSNNPKIEYAYLTNITFIFIVLIVNIFINFYKKIQIKGSLNNLLLFITSQILIWLSVVAISILNNNAFIITLNVFFASLASTVLLVVFLIRNKKINIVMLIMSIVLILLIQPILFSFGINYLLTSEKYSNYLFMTIFSKLSLIQIILITNLTCLFVLEAIILIQFFIVIAKIKKDKLKENYEK